MRKVSTWPLERPTVKRGSVGWTAWVKRSEWSGRVHKFSNMVKVGQLRSLVDTHHPKSRARRGCVSPRRKDGGGRGACRGDPSCQSWMENFPENYLSSLVALLNEPTIHSTSTVVRVGNLLTWASNSGGGLNEDPCTAAENLNHCISRWGRALTGWFIVVNGLFHCSSHSSSFWLLAAAAEAPSVLMASCRRTRWWKDGASSPSP